MAKIVIQPHHIIYGDGEHPTDEWFEPVYKSEHRIATLMQWYCLPTKTRKGYRISKGFISWLKYFVLRYEEEAIEL